MGSNKAAKEFSLREVMKIFREEARQITDNRKEAMAYATNAVRDFQNIYKGRIR